MLKPLLVALSLLLVLPGVSAMTEKEALYISADSVDIDMKKGVSIYNGNVHMQRGKMDIQAQRIEVYQKDNQLSYAHATGQPAQFQQESEDGRVAGEAQVVIYRAQQEQVEFRGEARLQQNDSRFSGETIHYDIKTEEVLAQGDKETQQRVETVIYPKEQEQVEEQTSPQ